MNKQNANEEPGRQDLSLVTEALDKATLKGNFNLMQASRIADSISRLAEILTAYNHLLNEWAERVPDPQSGKEIKLNPRND